MQRATAEFVGTALLLAAIVGSGIAAQRLSPDDIGLELLENGAATGAALIAIILAIGPVSGAHLNPAVTVADHLLGGIPRRAVVAYVSAQLTGGIAGTAVANLMFSLAPVTISMKSRSGGGLWLGEVVATFGLLLVIFGTMRSGRTGLVPFAVGTYIAAAYWFTSSTSFANPAVTIARMFSNSFAGIAPESAPGFILAEFGGAAIAIVTIKALYPRIREVADDLVVPHHRPGRKA